MDIRMINSVSQSRRRVVVTGIGIVSPLGIGAQFVWNRLIAGESGIGPITCFDASNLPAQGSLYPSGFGRSYTSC